MISLISKPVISALGGLSIGLAVFAGIQSYRLSQAQSSLLIEQSAHKADIAKWREGGIQATVKALQHARRIETEQNAITERIDNEAQSDLAAVRAKYERLRRSATVNSGSPGDTNYPRLVYCPGEPSDPAFCDRLLAFGERVQFFAEQAELNTTQLTKLLDLLDAQSSISRNSQ